MPNLNPNRVHKGVPAGGRFAEKRTPEADTSFLSAPLAKSVEEGLPEEADPEVASDIYENLRRQGDPSAVSYETEDLESIVRDAEHWQKVTSGEAAYAWGRVARAAREHLDRRTNGSGGPDLTAELEAADRKDFKRTAIPTVHREYEDYVARNTGPIAYIDDVVNDIADRHGIDVGGRHHAVRNETGQKLSHEVYLAAGQHRVNEMVAVEDKYKAAGYAPVTEYEPKEGDRIELQDGHTYRVKADKYYPTVDSLGEIQDWVLLPKGARTHGFSLNAQQRQQRAYEKAKERGWEEMNGPAVRMFKKVK